MLYQTQHLPLFQFHPFTSSTTPQLSTPPSSLTPLLLSQETETEMECLEGALKSSLRKDTALKVSPQTLLEELAAPNVQNVVASCDDFFVDDLLDFSLLEKEEPDNHTHDSTSVSPKRHNHEIHNNNHNHNPSFNDHFNSELTVPAEDVADLEWLSHFVEDSFAEYSVSFPTVTVTESLSERAPEPGNTGFAFKTPVPAKARSKRTRTGVRVWPLKSPSFTDTSSTLTSSSSSSSSSSPSSPSRICEEKRAKKRAAADGGAAQAARRCSHCGVQKTPQWRTGPLGAKTLCNACGVRYKSGRLLPEYRPACSPTFSSELHSNHHRKVLEMRRKKEVVVEPDTGSGSGSATLVPGF
ncbi:GATA transcription factor 5 [Cajanus cajan]|uniref:GATA transcription factor 14 n=1 Tax=Cajanus cajan TaxID=3821 RepID=A0A151S0V8_CAJCA|nr:GATA transcription factor 5 [Cajanus cajan]KYP48440.1 GATA transcription factor 14 [Cajanus cajan]